MRPITLPIYKHDESSHTLEELGIPYRYSETVTGEMTFYNIASIADFDEDGNHLTEIHANGQIFVCSLTLDQVKEVIRKAYETP